MPGRHHASDRGGCGKRDRSHFSLKAGEHISGEMEACNINADASFRNERSTSPESPHHYP
jgi:hypothetical protein